MTPRSRLVAALLSTVAACCATAFSLETSAAVTCAEAEPPSECAAELGKPPAEQELIPCLVVVAGEDGQVDAGEDVLLCDKSAGKPDGWCWRYGDESRPGCTSRLQNPGGHRYQLPTSQAEGVELDPGVELEVRKDEGIATVITRTSQKLTVCGFILTPVQNCAAQIPGPGSSPGPFGFDGGQDSLLVSTLSECGWSVETSDPFLELEGEGRRVGAGEVRYRVLPVQEGAQTEGRSGTIRIAGQKVPIRQLPGVLVTDAGCRIEAESGRVPVPESRVSLDGIPEGRVNVRIELGQDDDFPDEILALRVDGETDIACRSKEGEACAVDRSFRSGRHNLSVELQEDTGATGGSGAGTTYFVKLEATGGTVAPQEIRKLITGITSRQVSAFEVFSLQPGDFPDPPRTIELAYVRLPAPDPGVGARSPIVFLGDRTGLSGIDALSGPRLELFEALRAFGDVVAVDLRGAGTSQPPLNCRDDKGRRIRIRLPLSSAVPREAVLAEHAGRARECSRNVGADLSGYDALEVASDLEALRQHLNEERLVLWAEGWGTHVALAYTRLHPERVERLVLHSVKGMDETFSLPRHAERVLLAVSELAASQLPEVPNLAATIEELAARLDERPKLVRFRTENGKRVKVRVSGFDLQTAVSKALAIRAGILALPQAVVDMEAGDFRFVAKSAREQRRRRIDPIASSAMACASGHSRRLGNVLSAEAETGPESILGRTLEFPFPDVCGAWAVEDLGNEYRRSFEADLPALLIRGTLDPYSSKASTRSLSRDLAEAHILTVKNGAPDDLFLSSPRIRTTIEEFLQGETPSVRRIRLPLDFACCRAQGDRR